jgi:hypothetical protein
MYTTDVEAEAAQMVGVSPRSGKSKTKPLHPRSILSTTSTLNFLAGEKNAA